MNERKTDKPGKMKAAGTRHSLPAVAGVSKSCRSMTLRRSLEFATWSGHKVHTRWHLPASITLVSGKRFWAAKCRRHDTFVGLANRIGPSSVRSVMFAWGKTCRPYGANISYRVDYKHVAPTGAESAMGRER